MRRISQYLVRDGVDGPKFDQILNIPEVGGNLTKVTWNEDRSRYAYFGRVGQEYVVMVAPGGKHWYLIIHTRSQYRQHWQLAIEGRPGPVADEEVAPVFSKDGEHHAYMFSRKAPSGQLSMALIHDGKPAAYQAGDPQFTADGLHIFTTRQVPRTNATEVLAEPR